jgi:hypothetical protein
MVMKTRLFALRFMIIKTALFLLGFRVGPPPAAAGKMESSLRNLIMKTRCCRACAISKRRETFFRVSRFESLVMF